MAAFPTLNPSSRTYTPGEYPHSPFTGMSGIQNRVRNSNVMVASQLRLTFVGITESQMLSILTHYQGQQGTFSSFGLPSAIWSGTDDPASYQLSGYGWRYIEPPSVSDAMCADAYDVELAMETVPPEGTALLGLNSIVQFSIVGGIATAANGANLTVTASIEYGAAVAAGLAATVTASLAAGTATINATSPPFDRLVAWNITGGTATGGASTGLEITVPWSLTAGTASGVPTDPSFSSVQLLLHMNGSNGSTTFTDSSSAARTVTPSGNAQISTAQSKFGGASGYFDGSGDYLTATVTGGFGSGDFTLEFWYYKIANTGMLFNSRSSGTSANGFDIRHNLEVTTDFVFLFSAATISTNQWVHVAITRSGTTLRRFINGTLNGSTTTSTNYSGTDFKIGGSPHGNVGYLTGYIDDVRVTVGTARYTASFTPPTAAFPDS